MSDTEFMAKSDPIRPLEIFTGAGRRRSWSAEQKAQIVAESLSSGASVCAVARRHGLTPQQLFTWRRQARSGGVARTERLGFASVVVSAVPIACNTPLRAAA